MKPSFSIIVPCCDVEAFARDCFDSVLSQPFRDWELLAVVETSKDGTEAIVREYAAKDPRISVSTQPRSGSPAAPRNTALERATGEYVIFLDGDDTIAEGSLQRLHYSATRISPDWFFPMEMYIAITLKASGVGMAFLKKRDSAK